MKCRGTKLEQKLSASCEQLQVAPADKQLSHSETYVCVKIPCNVAIRGVRLQVRKGARMRQKAEMRFCTHGEVGASGLVQQRNEVCGLLS